MDSPIYHEGVRWCRWSRIQATFSSCTRLNQFLPLRGRWKAVRRAGLLQPPWRLWNNRLFVCILRDACVWLVTMKRNRLMWVMDVWRAGLWVRATSRSGKIGCGVAMWSSRGHVNIVGRHAKVTWRRQIRGVGISFGHDGEKGTEWNEITKGQKSKSTVAEHSLLNFSAWWDHIRDKLCSTRQTKHIRTKRWNSGMCRFAVIASTKPKRMMGTQDLEQGIVTLQEMFPILMVCAVKPQHGEAKMDAPSMKDSMDQGMP